jgi:SulP family sulfate permease
MKIATDIVQKVKENWKSGLTVSLISLPLAVTLAVASHASPVQGVITAIWAGLISSLFGGSNYNIIGPTGALSGLLSSYAILHGTGILPTLAILSGILILAAYLLKLEKYLIFVPSNTIHGFVLGVAFIIILNQMNFAFGLLNLPVHESFVQNIYETLSHASSFNPVSAVLFTCSLAVLWALSKLAPYIPGAILISPFGIILGYLSSHHILSMQVHTLEAKFTNLSPNLVLPFKFSLSMKYIIPAVTIAVISIIETMVSARIADGMTKTKHNKNKEMLGLGLANIVCGCAGGIPATAALARTTLNIKSGATHKTSAFIGSLCVTIISMFLLEYFKYMPLPVVAAILTMVGINMIELEHFQRMFKTDTTNFVISMVVATVTVFEDPIIGILLGASISMFIFMKKLSTGQYELSQKASPIHIEPMPKEDTLVYSIKGELAYINAQSHIARFENIPTKHKNIVIDLRAVSFIDHDGLEACEKIVDILQAQSKSVRIIGARALTSKIIAATHIPHELTSHTDTQQVP